MTSFPPPKGLNELVMEQEFSLEELLDSASLVELAHSFDELFGVPLRIYSASGALLADAMKTPRLYSVLESDRVGRRAVQDLIASVRRSVPKGAGTLTLPCISGGYYLISGICYEGRVLGRTILGPIISPNIESLPELLQAACGEADQAEVLSAWRELPRMAGSGAQRLDAHLRASLNLLVFSGLKAHLASSMHMAAVHESYRELTEKNKKLSDAYERLKELDRLKSNFLATVSHELRTPLTSIIGYSEMMLEGISGELTEEQREFLNTIHEKGEQLLELIKSLLDLSKLESGTMSLRRAGTDCGLLAEQVVSTLAPAARKRGVTILAKSAPDLPHLDADADRLRQVLNNLCENALKFTPEGGTVTIEVERVWLKFDDMGSVGSALMAAPQRAAIEFRVRDTGIGIPEDQRERVFDAFYQVDNSATREVGGTGLGLSIVKRLVDAHDGTIRVIGNAPTGCVFVVTLPILKKS